MKVSCIIPIYGVERFIEKSSRSYLSQTYPNIQYIFVNDCTQDNSMQILQNVFKEYPNREIQIINKTNNEGLPQARKAGLEIATGEYIIHFDSDDWVEENYIEMMVSEVAKTGADIVISDYYENYPQKEDIVRCPHFIDSEIGINMMLRASLHSAVWNKLVRRSLYKNVCFPTHNMHEDLVVMVQLFTACNKFAFVNNPFYHYNLFNQNSLTQSSNRRSVSAKDAYFNLKLIEDFLCKTDNMKRYEAAFCNFANTFKGAIMMHKSTRNYEWLYTLYAPSKKYVFSENRLSLAKQILLFLAFHKIRWPYYIIDMITSIMRKNYII